MQNNIKKALIIDLETKSSEVKSFTDINKFIGGLGVGLKLYNIYKEKSPVVFSVGPLNGFFPFASKTSIVVSDDGVIEDLYIGGNLSTRIKFTGLDSIVICGKSDSEVVLDIQNTNLSIKPAETDIGSLGLPGRRSVLNFSENKLLLQDYFTTPENFLEKNLKDKNVSAICVTGTEVYKPENFKLYEKLYAEILSRQEDLRAEPGKYPSCSNCPEGCGKSKDGELGGNVLVHSLVACHLADKIYSDIGIVFSCLNVLGYDYTHEDLENLPKLIEDTIREIS